jgi:hypothetical protein
MGLIELYRVPEIVTRGRLNEAAGAAVEEQSQYSPPV